MTSLALAIGCFFLCRIMPSVVFVMAFFIAALIMLLIFFRRIITFRQITTNTRSSDAFYNIWMLVIILTFSLTFYFFDDITAYDILSNDIELTLALLIVSFMIIAYCGIILFKPLRLYGNAFYTACYTACLALSSALLFLFGDLLPENDIADALQLFATLSSLSLALSLALLEYDKKKAA